MTIGSQSKRDTARMQFRRLIIYLVLVGVVMVAGSLVYLRSYGPMTATLIATVTLGVFVSIVLGGGLMAAGFFSANSGIDDSVASAAKQEPDVQGEP